MKRPLVPVALCYAAGLIVGDQFIVPLGTLFLWSFTVLVVAGVWSKFREPWLGLALFLLGGTNLGFHQRILSPHDLRTVTGGEARYATVVGTLAETPSLRVFDPDDVETFRTVARVEVERCEWNSRSQSACGVVAVMTEGVLPAEYFSSQRVRITGVLALPRPPVVRGLFDYRTHLERQGIHFQLSVKSASQWTLLSSNRPPFTDRFIAWASRTLALGATEEDEELRLNWAMVLGWKTALTDDVSEPFMRSGTMHVFAISGLHIALIAGILLSVLRVFRLSRIVCGAAVIPLIWFYTAATGWQPSAIRSTIMMTVIIGGWALKRPGDLLNSLAVAGLVILIWQPQQLFQPSFQLSFFVVLSIALLSPPLESWRDRLLRTDPLLPKELLPRWRRWADAPLHWASSLVVVSLAAWLGSLPLTAYYFHLVNPVALLANVVVVPLSSGALAAALGSLACGAWCGWLTEIFNHSAWILMKAMVGVSEWATTLPGAYAWVTAPPWWIFAFYYIAVFGLVSGKVFLPAWRKPAMCAGFCFCAAVVIAFRAGQHETRITVLPLNGGHAVYVDNPGARDDCLFDCGSSNAVRFTTIPFLRSRGVNRISHFAMTHGDFQDISGAIPFKNEVPVQQALTSPVKYRSPIYRRVLAEMETNGPAIMRVSQGDSAAGWRVLHPRAEDKFAQADDASLVVMREVFSMRVLLLSDLGREGQEALALRTEDLRADIVVTGLPEKSEPLGWALLERIQPKLIVVADAEFPAPARAGRALQERLRAGPARVVFTRNTGSVEISITPSGWRCRVARPADASESGWWR